MAAQICCPTCGHRPAAPRATIRSITQPCADFRACWTWNHTCRLRIKVGGRSRASSRSAYAPAILRGVVIPQVALAVAS